MKRGFTCFILLIIISIVSVGMAGDKKIRVIFFGDSITESGIKPGGYITLIDSIAKAQDTKRSYEFIGAGISGHKVYDLYLRLQQDVLSRKPDVVVIYIGINDVWHKALAGTGTDADRFEKFYQAIITQLQQQHIRVVLCTPAVIGEKTDFTNPQDGDLNAYAQIVRRLAEINGLVVVDLRQDFLAYNLTHNVRNEAAGILTTDRVHLNKNGNQLVATSIWKILKSMDL